MPFSLPQLPPYFPSPLEIRVYTLTQALEAGAALTEAQRERGIEGRLSSPLNATGTWGVGCCAHWDQRIHLKFPGLIFVVDCGQDAGRALSGLRLGLKWLRCQGHPHALHRLRKLAATQGASIMTTYPPAERCLDLFHVPDKKIKATCAAFLEAAALTTLDQVEPIVAPDPGETINARD